MYTTTYTHREAYTHQEGIPTPGRHIYLQTVYNPGIYASLRVYREVYHQGSLPEGVYKEVYHQGSLPEGVYKEVYQAG